MTREERDRKIREWAERGWKGIDLAYAFGLSPARISCICNREDADSRAKRDEEIRRWRAAGWSGLDLAQAFGLSEGAVYQIVKGIRSKHVVFPIKFHRDWEIRRWRAAGWTLRDLAYAFGVSRQRIHQICKRIIIEQPPSSTEERGKEQNREPT